ncbi:MAG: RNA polymerase sigma factor [Saprospiraceae bacterium]|nr:RNA polymerase sigma factor [Saprospiraceae bacterium]
MDHSPEQLLLQQCQKGQLNAQRDLYERYKSVLFAVCIRYARDHAEAEDLLQETFIVIFRDIRQFRQEGSLEGWLRKVTIRVALTQLKKKYPTRFAQPFESLPPDFAVSVPSDSDLNEEAILGLLQQMPEGYRTVFNLHCVEEYSYEEIAQTIGVAESTVRSQYVRARRFLRKLVEKMLSEIESGG